MSVLHLRGPSEEEDRDLSPTLCLREAVPAAPLRTGPWLHSFLAAPSSVSAVSAEKAPAVLGPVEPACRRVGITPHAALPYLAPDRLRLCVE